MRRAIGAQEELCAAAGRGFDQGDAVALALEHRKAVIVRPDTAGKDRVAVVQQVMRRDGGAGVGVARVHILGCLARRDVLEHDLEFRKIASQRNQLGVDEHRLAVEQVDVGRSHFAVHQQHQPIALHRLQRRISLADVRDTGIAVGGGASWVQLHRDDPSFTGPADLVGRQPVGQVKRHQWLEGEALRHSSEDALAVGAGLRRRGHRRSQIGHDDRPAELRRRMRHHCLQGCPIAYVQVPVVGACDRDGLAGGNHPAILALPSSSPASRAESVLTRARRTSSSSPLPLPLPNAAPTRSSAKWQSRSRRR